VTTVAGLEGGVIRGHVGPGVAGAELPEDAIEDGTAIKGRAAAVGWRGGGRIGSIKRHCSSVRFMIFE